MKVLLGTRKGLFILERRGDGWAVATHAHHGVPVPFATVDPRDGTIWASLDHGHWGPKLSRSVDGGQTWTEVDSPKLPEGQVNRDQTVAAVRYLWFIQPGPASQPGRIYLGTDPGALFVSDDGGSSWALNEALWNEPERTRNWFGGGRDQPGIHSIAIDPRDPAHLFVALSCAGVYESTDGGASWKARNKGLKAEFLPNPDAEVGHDPHYFALCEGTPDVAWQQNHCGVFRSTDGSQTWTDISEADGPARFGFVIAADPRDPLTAWVVPAESDEVRIAVKGLSVSRTTDGGQTWTSFRTGLPQENCWDIVYRHALDLSGDSLFLGSTTGNLYWSDDRGDTWSCAGNHFPMVYSVRYAT